MKKIYDETEERKGGGGRLMAYTTPVVSIWPIKNQPKREDLFFLLKQNVIKKWRGGGGERGVCVYVRTRQTKWRHTQQYPPHYRRINGII